MASVNKVIILGNLGADPEARSTASGQIVVNFNVATNERWTKKATGQPEERTEWHKVVVWGRLAELCRDYLAKGRTVYVEGRLQTRKWEDREGHMRYTTEIVAQTIQFIGGGGGRDRVAETPTGVSTEPTTASGPTPDQQGPPPFDSDEEIPF